jgi:ACT domain-containing protein
MTNSLFIQYLGDSPQLRMIDFFLDNGSDYSKKEIIENVGISKTTFYKIWPMLEKFEIFVNTRKFGNVQLYSLNKKSIIVKQFMSLDLALSKQAMQKIGQSKEKKTELELDNQI